MNDARLGGVKTGGRIIIRGLTAGTPRMRGERGEGDCKGMNMWNKSSRGFKPDAKVVGRNEMEIKTNVCIRLVF